MMYQNVGLLIYVHFNMAAEKSNN